MMHIPVLKKEVLEYLSPKKNENFIDGTLGEGGHTIAILERNKPEGKILGIEIDDEQIKRASERLIKFRKRLVLVNNSYTNLKKIVKENNFQPVSGVLLDLGISSWQIEESKRGFSFLKDETLDMRFRENKNNSLTAREIVNKWPIKEIERIFKEFGEERFSKKIALEIIKERRDREIKTTFQLGEIIKNSVPFWYQRQKIHFATRVFQALRIAVNGELENIKGVLPQAIDILEKGGRIVVISFHSLEERIIKNFFKEKSKEGLLKIMTAKPVKANFLEIKNNPRSRSAKLRAAIKI